MGERNSVIRAKKILKKENNSKKVTVSDATKSYTLFEQTSSGLGSGRSMLHASWNKTGVLLDIFHIMTCHDFTIVKFKVSHLATQQS